MIGFKFFQKLKNNPNSFWKFKAICQFGMRGMQVSCWGLTCFEAVLEKYFKYFKRLIFFEFNQRFLQNSDLILSSWPNTISFIKKNKFTIYTKIFTGTIFLFFQIYNFFWITILNFSIFLLGAQLSDQINSLILIFLNNYKNKKVLLGKGIS